MAQNWEFMVEMSKIKSLECNLRNDTSLGGCKVKLIKGTTALDELLISGSCRFVSINMVPFQIMLS